MKKIILFAFILLALASCTATYPTCLTKEQNRYMGQDNHGSRKATCLTPDCKRYQFNR